MDFDKLLSPIKLRGLTLPNRIVMTAMGTQFAKSSKDGRGVTEKYIAYQTARAKGGVGLAFTDCCSVDERSAPTTFLSIAHDRYLGGMSSLCSAVHEAGGRIGIQLWQGGRAIGKERGAEILVPSPLALADANVVDASGEIVEAMTEQRIREVIESYRAAAKRAVTAGFDTIEIHAGHNYLLHSFLSAGFNHRDDDWGGSLENRMRLPLAVVDAVRSEMPDDIPLFMRVVWKDDGLENGLTPEEVIKFCRCAGERGVDVINVSRGNIVNYGTIFETPPTDLPNGFNAEAAGRIRKETGMTVLVAGRINTPERAETILEKGQADLVAMSRAQLADPEFCNKVREGRLSSIDYCTGCCQGCYDYLVKSLRDKKDPRYEHITCVRNPILGEEATLTPRQTDSPKRVLIVGGGMAGIEAAKVLNLRGHHPVLFEKAGQLGGQFIHAGALPRKRDFTMAATSAGQRIIDEGVEVHLNSEVTPETIAQINPDAVVLATGAIPRKLSIPGIDAKHVMNALDILDGSIDKDLLKGRAVVIGSGLVGLEVAELLAEEGCRVTVLAKHPNPLAKLNDMRRVATEMALEDRLVTFIEGAICTAIGNDWVSYETNGEVECIDADLAVVACGMTPAPVDDLEDACCSMGIDCFKVGDAAAPRTALEAIRESYEVASSL